MSVDPGTKTGPGPGKPPQGRPDDETFKRSMADLSRRLGERAARQSAADPQAAAAARRAALEAYDRARARRLRAVLGFAMAAVAAAGFAYLAPTIGARPVPPSPGAVASTEPAPPLETAAAEAASAAESHPAPVPAEATALSPVLVISPSGGAAALPDAPLATASQPAPLQPTPTAAPLRRDEVREVQARLRSFGLDPGPIDGVAGPRTEDAVMHYQRHRSQRQTGEIDRQLLEQLRQDPAPQVAQRPVAPPAARPVARTARPTGPSGSNDPFQPVREAGDRFGHWLQSLTR